MSSRAKAARALLLMEGMEILDDIGEEEREEEVAKKKSKRSCSVQPWLASGDLGQSASLVYKDILMVDDKFHFNESFQMDRETFQMILVFMFLYINPLTY